MKLARWRPARSAARSGSHFSISTTGMPAAPGTRTELRRPEMWASGEGIRATSSVVSPWAVAMLRAL